MKTLASLCACFMVLILYLALPPHLYFSVLGLGAVGVLASSASSVVQKEDEDNVE